jgi:hypothetical protein
VGRYLLDADGTRWIDGVWVSEGRHI